MSGFPEDPTQDGLLINDQDPDNPRIRASGGTDGRDQGEAPETDLSDERLAALVAELPRDVRPESDLWPEISGRLIPRESVQVLEPSPRADRRGTVSDWALRVAAASFFMALGGALTLWLASPNSGVNPGAVAETPDAGATALVSNTSRPRASSSIDVLEAEYLQAKEVLWSRAIENRDALPPGTLKVVEKNLDILELAIRDLRRALELDPGNPDLERRLMDQHQRSIEVLRKVVREV